MKIVHVDLNTDCSEVIREAVDVLSRGGVIVYPTDTVYGLGANALNTDAVEQVFKIKNRQSDKPLPIVARNLGWVRELAFVPPKLEKVLSEVWPGPTTVILPNQRIIPKVLIAGLHNVGIRIPDHQFIDRILAKFGYPLTSTSANIAGEEATGDINQIIGSFTDRIWKPDLVIDAGVLPKSKPSTVIDLSTLKPKILRAGPNIDLIQELFNIK